MSKDEHEENKRNVQEFHIKVYNEVIECAHEYTLLGKQINLNPEHVK